MLALEMGEGRFVPNVAALSHVLGSWLKKKEKWEKSDVCCCSIFFFSASGSTEM